MVDGSQRAAARPRGRHRRSDQPVARARVRAGARDPRRHPPRPGARDAWCRATTTSTRSGRCRQKLFRAAPRAVRQLRRQAAVEFPLVRVRGEVAIVGLSTALPSPLPLADGWVGGAQLAALDDGARRRSRQVPHRAAAPSARTPTATRSCAACAIARALQKVLARARLRAGPARPRAPRSARDAAGPATGRSRSSASAAAPTTTRAPIAARATMSTPSRRGGSSASRRACTRKRRGAS